MGLGRGDNFVGYMSNSRPPLLVGNFCFGFVGHAWLASDQVSGVGSQSFRH